MLWDDAEDLDRAAVRLGEVEQALDQSGLAGAVHTDQSEGLPGGHVERKVRQRGGDAVALAHGLEAQARVESGVLIGVLVAPVPACDSRRRGCMSSSRRLSGHSAANSQQDASQCLVRPTASRQTASTIRRVSRPHSSCSVSADNLVELRDVEFRYDARPVLTGIDMTIPRGKVVAIMGLSGSGKTTMLRLIGGQVKPSARQRERSLASPSMS